MQGTGGGDILISKSPYSSLKIKKKELKCQCSEYLAKITTIATLKNIIFEILHSKF